MEELIEELIKKLDKYTVVSKDTNPALVVYVGKVIPREIKKLSEKALYRMVKIEEAEKIINKSSRITCYFRGNGRGKIGALAAIGNQLVNKDHTYELLAYRKMENIGKTRRIDLNSVIKINENPKTFVNFDPETRRVLITPHGRDPVLFGIRGEAPKDVYEAFLKIKTYEEIDRWVIFVTNQGTEEHLKRRMRINEVKPYDQAIIEGVLQENPLEIRGGHVILKIRDQSGVLTCMVYAESGNMNIISKKFLKGDILRVFGGIKEKNNRLMLNVQKIEILKTHEADQFRPICAKCGRKMSSQGKNKGYVCKCGYHVPYIDIRASTIRYIKPKLLLPPYRSIRHLSKPIKRYGRENIRHTQTITFSQWCSFVD